jgi:hypothetical protein
MQKTPAPLQHNYRAFRMHFSWHRAVRAMQSEYLQAYGVWIMHAYDKQ